MTEPTSTNPITMGRYAKRNNIKLHGNPFNPETEVNDYDQWMDGWVEEHVNNLPALDLNN